MTIKGYLPSLQGIVKVAVAIVVIFLILKYLPISENIKNLFRV